MFTGLPRVQELCESHVEVAVLGSLVPNKPTVSVDVKQHFISDLLTWIQIPRGITACRTHKTSHRSTAKVDADASLASLDRGGAPIKHG